ncbi:VOC family protein [Gorillibacterium timonense]|uniref:VOC family protein n=1 Tax=Gorillibacterium timonense TaxID=1689269 RepID=UPI00071C318D|nr:VOC family protein [Gorillibacterium timonense]
MIVTPNYHFDGQCKEALRLYEQAFQGKITVLIPYRDASPNDISMEDLTEEEKDYVYHAEMRIGNQRFMFSDDRAAVPKGRNLSMVITFDDPSEVRDAYHTLLDGGTAIHPLCETTYSSCFASVIDRYGMRWELMTENPI